MGVLKKTGAVGRQNLKDGDVFNMKRIVVSADGNIPTAYIDAEVNGAVTYYKTHSKVIIDALQIVAKSGVCDKNGNLKEQANVKVVSKKSGSDAEYLELEDVGE